MKWMQVFLPVRRQQEQEQEQEQGDGGWTNPTPAAAAAVSPQMLLWQSHLKFVGSTPQF